MYDINRRIYQTQNAHIKMKNKIKFDVQTLSDVHDFVIKHTVRFK